MSHCDDYHELRGFPGLYRLRCGTPYVTVPTPRVKNPSGQTVNFPVRLVEINGHYVFIEKRPKLRVDEETP